MQKPFIQQHLVSAADTDELGHVNNVHYVMWLQTVAAAHWNELSAKSPLAQTWVWVVRRHEINYLKAAYPGDLLTISTFVGESRGTISKRHTHFHNQKEELICEAITHWCAIDKKSGKPKRIDPMLLSALGLGDV